MSAEAGEVVAPPLHRVFIPPPHRELTGGQAVVEVAGGTVGEVVAALEERFPGIGARLVAAGELRPGIAVAIDGVLSPRGLRQRLGAPCEIHFVRAMGGGAGFAPLTPAPSPARIPYCSRHRTGTLPLSWSPLRRRC